MCGFTGTSFAASGVQLALDVEFDETGVPTGRCWVESELHTITGVNSIGSSGGGLAGQKTRRSFDAIFPTINGKVSRTGTVTIADPTQPTTVTIS